MAEDQDKAQQTEEPTAKLLEQARENGDVVKSTEVTTFILLGGGTLAIAKHAEEVGLAVPSEPHDRRVTGAVTPEGVRRLL